MLLHSITVSRNSLRVPCLAGSPSFSLAFSLPHVSARSVVRSNFPPSFVRHFTSHFHSHRTNYKNNNNMSGAPVTSSYVLESTVIKAPVAKVWHLIKLQDFAKWYTALESSSEAKGISPDVTDASLWSFKDGTKLTVKQEEHSAINHSITYSVVEAEPALSYHSVLSTITVSPITSGELEGGSYVTWSGSFSSDADAQVIEDARFKRREALADLAKAVKA